VRDRRDLYTYRIDLEIIAESRDNDANVRDQSPASILWGPCDTTVLRGARVVLETSYTGNPEPRVQWCRAVSRWSTVYKDSSIT